MVKTGPHYFLFLVSSTFKKGSSLFDFKEDFEPARDSLCPRGYSTIFNMGSIPILGVRNFPLNQYLGSVKCELQHGQKFNILGPEKLKKEESWNMVRVSKNIRRNIQDPQNIRLNI